MVICLFNYTSKTACIPGLLKTKNRTPADIWNISVYVNTPTDAHVYIIYTCVCFVLLV